MFIINILIMLANDPSSSMMEQVYEQNAQQNVSVHSCIWIRTTYRQCTYGFCMQRSNVTHMDGLAAISHKLDHLNANAREIVLAEVPRSPLSGVVIRLGGFHNYRYNCGGKWNRCIQHMHVNSSFERDNRCRTVLFS